MKRFIFLLISLLPFIGKAQTNEFNGFIDVLSSTFIIDSTYQITGGFSGAYYQDGQYIADSVKVGYRFAIDCKLYTVTQVNLASSDFVNLHVRADNGGGLPPLGGRAAIFNSTPSRSLLRGSVFGNDNYGITPNEFNCIVQQLITQLDLVVSGMSIDSSGTTFYLTNGVDTVRFSVNDADADPLNELNQLSVFQRVANSLNADVSNDGVVPFSVDLSNLRTRADSVTVDTVGLGLTGATVQSAIGDIMTALAATLVDSTRLANGVELKYYQNGVLIGQDSIDVSGMFDGVTIIGSGIASNKFRVDTTVVATIAKANQLISDSLDGNGLISALPLGNVSIAANNNDLRLSNIDTFSVSGNLVNFQKLVKIDSVLKIGPSTSGLSTLNRLNLGGSYTTTSPQSNLKLTLYESSPGANTIGFGASNTDLYYRASGHQFYTGLTTSPLTLSSIANTYSNTTHRFRSGGTTYFEFDSQFRYGGGANYGYMFDLVNPTLTQTILRISPSSEPSNFTFSPKIGFSTSVASTPSGYLLYYGNSVPALNAIVPNSLALYTTNANIVNQFDGGNRKFVVQKGTSELISAGTVIQFYKKYKFPNSLPTNGQLLGYAGAADSSLAWINPIDTLSLLANYTTFGDVNNLISDSLAAFIPIDSLNSLVDVDVTSSPDGSFLIKKDGTWQDSLMVVITSNDTTALLTPYALTSEVKSIVNDTAIAVRAEFLQSISDSMRTTRLLQDSILVYYTAGVETDRDTIRTPGTGGGGGLVDSTRIIQDSIAVYYQAGVEIGRDTIRLPGSAGGALIDSTRIIQDSIAIYYQNGSEVGRDTIRFPAQAAQTLAFSSPNLSISVGNSVSLSPLLSGYPTGSASANQLAYWSSSNTITGSINLTYSTNILNLTPVTGSTGYTNWLNITQSDEPGNGATRAQIGNSASTLIWGGYGSSVSSSLSNKAFLFSNVGSGLILGAANTGDATEIISSGVTSVPAITVASTQKIGFGVNSPSYILSTGGNDAFGIPRGTTAQRPTIATASGQPLRWNTTTQFLEIPDASSAWRRLITLPDATPTTGHFIQWSGSEFSTAKAITPADTAVMNAAFIDGGSSANNVSYWSGSKSITGSQNFQYDNTLKRLLLYSDNTVSGRGIVLSQNTSDIAGASMAFEKTRGNYVSKTAVTSGDIIGAFVFKGYSGTQFITDNALFGGSVSGTVTTTSVPTSLFFISGATGSYNPDILVHHDGNVGIGSTGNGSIVSGVTTPARTMTVYGEVRVTDLTTDTPTKIVGADADGDFSQLQFSVAADSIEKYIDPAMIPGIGEVAQDNAASMLTGATHSGVSVSYNDAGNALEITNTSAAGSGLTKTGQTFSLGGATPTAATFTGAGGFNWFAAGVSLAPLTGKVTLSPFTGGIDINIPATERMFIRAGADNLIIGDTASGFPAGLRFMDLNEGWRIKGGNGIGTSDFLIQDVDNSNQTVFKVTNDNGAVTLAAGYGTGSITGTAAYNASFDSNGKLIATTNPGGSYTFKVSAEDAGIETINGSDTLQFWNGSGGIDVSISQETATRKRILLSLDINELGSNTPDSASQVPFAFNGNSVEVKAKPIDLIKAAENNVYIVDAAANLSTSGAFTDNKEVYIWLNMTSGATSNHTITIPNPDGANINKKITIFVEDNNTTYNYTIAPVSTSRMYYEEAGGSAPSAKDNYPLNLYQIGVGLRLVSMNRNGTWYWVPITY